MHKGVILLMQEKNANSARTRAEDFMHDHCHEKHGICDWFQIGGRWMGTLDGYKPESDIANYQKCVYCKGTGKSKGTACNHCTEYDPQTQTHKPGKFGVGMRFEWPTHWKEHEGDALALSKCLDVVRAWVQDPDKEAAAMQAELEKNWPNDRGMKGYFMKRQGQILSQEFCFDTNVFNIESYDYAIPKETRGWFAVIVDMHS